VTLVSRLRDPLKLLAGRSSGRSNSRVRLGALDRTDPFNLEWGRGRGKPIDRLYIERFLELHRADIRGRTLEAQNDRYVRTYGMDIVRSDILDVSRDNHKATIVADLAHAPDIPDAAFDCVVLTQVLQYVFEVRAALQTIGRILAPGGVLLATVPGITRISVKESKLYGDWWRFTAQSAKRLAAEVFGSENVEVETYGNVLAAAGFLYGLGADDFRSTDLDVADELFEVIVAIRCVKTA
jgi:SAM-dependent methyltransferase